MRKWISAAAFAAASQFCVAQAAQAGSPQCQLIKFAEFPVTLRGVPMVTARVDGQEATFIVDSGAFFSLISPGPAAQMGLKLSAAPFGMTATSGNGNFSTKVATVKKFEVAGQIVPNLEFLVGGSETQATGLLGQNILTLGDAEYDLPGGVVRLFKPQGCSNMAMAYWASDRPYSVIDVEPTQGPNRHIIAPVFVNGTKMRAMFDTGSSGSSMTLAAAKRAGINPGDPGVEPADRVGGLGSKLVDSWTAPRAVVKIGDEEIRGKGLRISDRSALGYDMIIGADFFRAHRVYVSGKRRKLYFTYSGGPVFDDTPPKTMIREAPGAATAKWEIPTGDRPTLPDADAYSRRGAVEAARNDFPLAVADFSKAIDMSPGEPRYLVQRSRAYMALAQPALAVADLDLAIGKKPDLIEARIGRAMLNLAKKDQAAARADLDAAAKAAPKEADERFALAGLYAGMTDWSASLSQFDIWIAVHPADVRRPDALNGRCWARALLGQALPKALDDCNLALRLRPKNAAYLDSRGLVRLRMGDLPKAIEDYDAALAIQPGSVWSRFGRGLAKLRGGHEAEGKADIAAAIAIDGTLPARAASYGIILTAADPR